jgi:hypothetical protein
MRSFLIAGMAAALFMSVASAASIPREISNDPTPDEHFPASSVVLHVPSHGVAINGLAYLPAGAGPHPVFILLHGLPGNEKNLDLAQAVRRAGWIAVSSIRSKGGHQVTKTHVATDHAWSDRRIELAADVITWLKRLP